MHSYCYYYNYYKLAYLINAFSQHVDIYLHHQMFISVQLLYNF